MGGQARVTSRAPTVLCGKAVAPLCSGPGNLGTLRKGATAILIFCASREYNFANGARVIGAHDLQNMFRVCVGCKACKQDVHTPT